MSILVTIIFVLPCSEGIDNKIRINLSSVVWIACASETTDVLFFPVAIVKIEDHTSKVKLGIHLQLNILCTIFTQDHSPSRIILYLTLKIALYWHYYIESPVQMDMCAQPHKRMTCLCCWHIKLLDSQLYITPRKGSLLTLQEEVALLGTWLIWNILAFVLWNIYLLVRNDFFFLKEHIQVYIYYFPKWRTTQCTNSYRIII